MAFTVQSASTPEGFWILSLGDIGEKVLRKRQPLIYVKWAINIYIGGTTNVKGAIDMKLRGHDKVVAWLATYLRKVGFKVKGEHRLLSYKNGSLTIHYKPDLIAEKGDERFIVEYLRRCPISSIVNVPSELLSGYKLALVPSSGCTVGYVKSILRDCLIPCELWFYDHTHRKLDTFIVSRGRSYEQKD